MNRSCCCIPVQCSERAQPGTLLRGTRAIKVGRTHQRRTSAGTSACLRPGRALHRALADAANVSDIVEFGSYLPYDEALEEMVGADALLVFQAPRTTTRYRRSSTSICTRANRFSEYSIRPGKPDAYWPMSASPRARTSPMPAILRDTSGRLLENAGQPALTLRIRTRYRTTRGAGSRAASPSCSRRSYANTAPHRLPGSGAMVSAT